MNRKSRKTPLMSQPVQAGFPSPAEHYIEKMLDLDEYLSAHPESTYYVRVAGDSMTGAGIFPGDILCVDRSIDFFDGAIIVASVDGEFTVKYLRKNGGQLYLRAANPNYPPIFFGSEQDVRCWGVVTGLVRKFQYAAGRQKVTEPERVVRSKPVRNPGFKITDGRRRQRYEQNLSGQGKA
ncbi:MAG: translesion error-prone DNA polymerase V autoproteolytic subunit [Lentisphaeria bacterium]|nr:translesion error-prone DNA polymerase V autoproteolytic subunit [Lentisphaeria bacterium]